MANVAIAMRYGAKSVSLDAPVGTHAGVLTPTDIPRGLRGDACVEAALDAPIGLPPFDSLLAARSRVAILVSGRDRVTRADIFMPILIRRLMTAGVRTQDVTIYMATGTHVPFQAKDRRVIFGPGVDAGIRVIAHDCRDEAAQTLLCRSSFGNEIRVRRDAAEADIRILTGRITHHYFAGFTAGRKSVLPGIADVASIQRNHALVLSGDDATGCHPNARCGMLDGNPVHEEMLAAARAFNPTFTLNTVLDTSHELVGVYAGELDAAHRAGCAVVDRVFSIPIPAPLDIVVASAGGAPYDCSFMQALKTIMHAQAAVSDGGVLIVLARCPEGILPGFLNWDARLSLPDLVRVVRADYNLTGHNTVLLRRVLARIRVVLVSACPPSQVKALGLTPAGSVRDGWRRAAALCEARHPRWAAIPYGNVTVMAATSPAVSPAA